MAPARITEDEASRKTDVHISQLEVSGPVTPVLLFQFSAWAGTASKTALAQQQQAQTHTSPVALTHPGNSSPP